MVDLKFKYPMAVSGMGMATSGILSYACCRTGLVDAKAVIKPDFYIKRIMPVGLFMALTLWTGNEVYRHLTIALIQMLKVSEVHSQADLPRQGCACASSMAE